MAASLPTFTTPFAHTGQFGRTFRPNRGLRQGEVKRNASPEMGTAALARADYTSRDMRADPLAYLGEELTALKEQNLYRRLRILEDEQRAHTTVDQTSVVNLSSNNYLGLTTHPRLRAKALEAIGRFGVGTGSVRTIAGTMAIHMELERRLADFKKVEAVVVFQSGFTANAGTVSAILTRDDVVISDELNHASIIDGCRLSRAAIKVFPHKDVDAARRIIKDLPARQRKLLITDGVFSMDGDLGPLPALCDLAEETGCIMMVDDAHASGVFGKNGRGTIDHFGVHGRVDVQVGTLSKAVGALGGYVAGNRNLIEFLYHRARPFLFSTSHPPAVAAACLAAVDVLLEEPEIIERLWDNTRFFKKGLERLGFNTGISESPITPVIVGDGAAAMTLSDRLFAQGVFAQGIAFPTVAKDKARVRTIVTATHTKDELQFALDAFQKVGHELGLISSAPSAVQAHHP
jgi:glycine C-acetyltransferase